MVNLDLKKEYIFLARLISTLILIPLQTMRLSRPLPTSPRQSSTKQLKTFSSLELNSYKIDTSSLQQKAKQIQQLKASLQTQISQYKTSQTMFHSEIQKLTEQNNELRQKIRKLQTELNKLKLDQSNSPFAKTKTSTKNAQNQIKMLKTTIASLQDEVSSLKTKLAKKDQQILECEEYKKMYDIEVENKNNIMNFYQHKLAMFQRDKGVLISRYEQKISQLGSGFDMNAGTMIQLHGNSHANSFASSLPNGIKKEKKLSQEYLTEKNPVGDSKNKIQSRSPSTKNIKFIKTSRPSNNLKETKNSSDNDKIQQIYSQETPYKLLKASNSSESRNKQNTPFSDKSLKNQINQISISSSAVGRKDKLMSRDAKSKQSSRKTKNLAATSKTLRADDNFCQFIKKISSNLRRQNIRSQNLKNFAPVKNFINIASPLSSQVIELLEKFPFGPTEMDRLVLQQCVQKMRNHLHKRYSTWSGSLMVELLIDKIEDVEIGFELNSQEDDIIAGLSSDDQNS